MPETHEPGIHLHHPDQDRGLRIDSANRQKRKPWIIETIRGGRRIPVAVVNSPEEAKREIDIRGDGTAAHESLLDHPTVVVIKDGKLQRPTGRRRR